MTAIRTRAHAAKFARELGGSLRDLKHCSPSQIHTHDDCARKHFWGKRYGLPDPGSPATELGTRVHDVLDVRLGTGKWPEHRDAERAVRIARGGFGYLPKDIDKLPKHIEAQMDLATPTLPMVGRVDLVLPTLSLVIDHKSASSRRWAKTAAELRTDPQGISYPVWAQRQFDLPYPLRFAHVGYMTKGAPGGFYTEVVWEEAPLMQAWAAVQAKVGVIQTDAAKLDPADVAPNWEACGKYGGCPFFAQCTKVAGAGVSTSTQGGLIMALENELLASLAGKRKTDEAIEASTLGKVATLPTNTGQQTGSGLGGLALEVAMSPAGALDAVLAGSAAPVAVMTVGDGTNGTEVMTTLIAAMDPGAVNPPDAVAPTELPTKRPAAKKAKKKPTTRKPTGTLYIGCAPVGETVVLLETIAAPMLQAIAEDAGKVHYLAVKYAEWKPSFSCALVNWLDEHPLPTALVVTRFAPCADIALEILRPRFPHIVERLG